MTSSSSERTAAAPGRRRLLLVAYLFPPIGGGGVQRALKWARYLPDYGWDPVVLTVAASYHVTPDGSLLEQLPESVRIVRVPEPRWAAWARRRLAGRGAGGAPPSGPVGTAARRPSAPSFRLRTRALALARALQVPDAEAAWVPGAAAAAVREIRRLDCRAILSTSGPASNHLVGLLARLATGRPWLADFRDPWVENLHGYDSAVRKAVESYLERVVVARSDCLLTVTDAFARGFRRRYDLSVLQRIEMIPNGYDPADWEGLEPVRGPGGEGRMLVYYSGILYGGRSPRPFLEALAALLETGRLNRDRIRIAFSGVFDYPGRRENAEAVDELGLGDVIRVWGHLPHREHLQRLLGSDLLLLLGDTAPSAGDYIPGKLFEYLASGRPVLGLCRPGEASRLIEKGGLGRVADPEDRQAIASALLDAYRAWESGNWQAWRKGSGSAAAPGPVRPADEEPLRIYRRPEQARRLAALLDEITGGTV